MDLKMKNKIRSSNALFHNTSLILDIRFNKALNCLVGQRKNLGKLREANGLAKVFF
jgi:hypothetical protein